MMYIISTWIIYFKMGDWHLLIPFTYCTHLPSGNHPFILSTIHDSQDMAIGDIGVHKYVPQWILGYINIFKCVFAYFV